MIVISAITATAESLVVTALEPVAVGLLIRILAAILRAITVICVFVMARARRVIPLAFGTVLRSMCNAVSIAILLRYAINIIPATIIPIVALPSVTPIVGVVATVSIISVVRVVLIVRIIT